MRTLASALFASVLLFAVMANAQTVSKAMLTEDVAYLVRTVEAVHPNPYHHISKERFYALRDSVVRSLPDSASNIDAWEGMALLLASLNEGHSDLRYPPELSAELEKGGIRLFPVFPSSLCDAGLVVRADYSDDSLLRRSDTLVSINGIPAAELMNRLCATIGGLRSWREQRVVQDFAVQLYMHGVRPPYTIAYLRNGKTLTAKVEALTKEKLLANVASRRKTAVAQKAEPYHFSRIEGNVGYLDFRSMGTSLDSFSKFLEETFAGIKQNPINGLIIDLRRNGGGNSMLGYSLLHYITDKPFRMGAGSWWKVSDEYKQLIRASLKPDEEASGYQKNYLTKKAGDIISGESKPEKTGKNPLRYSGKVCVLIGPNTFSSANMTANAIQDYNLATLIGEPTGEPANDYGELYSGVLPNTKIKFVTSTKMFIRANGDATDMNPVLPHIEVKQNPMSEKDDVLNFAAAWLKKDE